MNAFHPDYPLGTSDNPITRRFPRGGEVPFVPVDEIPDMKKDPEGLLNDVEEEIRKTVQEGGLVPTEQEESKSGWRDESLFSNQKRILSGRLVRSVGDSAERIHPSPQFNQKGEGLRKAVAKKPNFASRSVRNERLVESDQRSRGIKPPKPRQTKDQYKSS